MNTALTKFAVYAKLNVHVLSFRRKKFKKIDYVSHWDWYAKNVQMKWSLHEVQGPY